MCFPKTFIKKLKDCYGINNLKITFLCCIPMKDFIRVCEYLKKCFVYC